MENTTTMKEEDLFELKRIRLKIPAGLSIDFQLMTVLFSFF